MSLTDPRVTLVSRSRQHGLGRLQNATCVRGEPVLGAPCPASLQHPPVRPSSCTAQSCTSALGAFTDDSNGEPKHPRAGGGPEATPPGPGGTAGAAEAGPRQRLLTHTTATTTPGVRHGIRRRCASRSSRCMPGLVVPGIWSGSLGSHSLPPAATATHQSRPPPGD